MLSWFPYHIYAEYNGDETSSIREFNMSNAELPDSRGFGLQIFKSVVYLIEFKPVIA